MLVVVVVIVIVPILVFCCLIDAETSISHNGFFFIKRLRILYHN